MNAIKDFAHVAYIIPNTDIVGEMDCLRMLPGHVVHAERMWLDEVSKQAEQKMVRDELPRALRYQVCRLRLHIGIRCKRQGRNGGY